MAVDYGIGVVFFLAPRKCVYGGPLCAVLTEFEDDLATEDACGMLVHAGHTLTKTYRWRR